MQYQLHETIKTFKALIKEGEDLIKSINRVGVGIDEEQADRDEDNSQSLSEAWEQSDFNSLSGVNN